MNHEGPQSVPIQLNVTYRVNSLPPARMSELAPLHNLSTTPTPQQTKRTGPASQTTPTKAIPNSNSRSIFDTSDGEYIKGLASFADRQAISHNNYEEKLKLFALHQAKATAALCDLMPEIQARPPPSVLTELEDVKREMATARSKEKELETTISGLTHKNKVFSSRCASFESQVASLEAENKETKQELTVAHNKEKEQETCISGLKRKNKALSTQIVTLKAQNKEIEKELTVARNKENNLGATISELKNENKVFSVQHASNESKIAALEAEDKKTKEELMVFRSKEKELEATISRLTHKNKVFSAQCATYESQIDALEVENKKTKEELMNVDKKYYAGARAAGYAEGLKEGKSKRLKSVEFLHHMTDASMQYFEYGFDSCQKQAEEQGFVGQLNKDSALKDAPEIKGWESSDQPH